MSHAAPAHHDPHRYDDPSLPPRQCTNCGATLHGPYCAQCGQHDVDYVRSFRHFLEELLENLFHFEGKFLVSVAWLLAKPGRLTQEFVNGRRQSQLNPLRFYIFATVLFFLGVHLLNHGHIFDFDRAKADKLAQTANANGELITSRLGEDSKNDRGDLAQRLADKVERNGTVDPKDVAEVLRSVANEKHQAAVASAKAAKPSTSEVGDAKTLKKQNRTDFETRLREKFDSGELRISHFVDEIEHRIPTILFIGMPVFALILKILHLGRGRYYLEHLVFSLHLHTWAFLVLMVGNGYLKIAALGGTTLRDIVAWVLFGWMGWYVVASFRTVYHQGWRKATFTAVLASMAYSAAITIIATVVIVGTVLWIVLE